MNLTLAVDEQTVERAREVARNQGMSLNELVRRYLEQVAGIRPGGAEAAERWRRFTAETRAMVAKCAPAEPWVFNRDELYERDVPYGSDMEEPGRKKVAK